MIRFGMKLPEIFNQLVRGYQKVRGQKPTGLDLIKIKQEAMQRFQDMRKVMDMKGNPIDPNKSIMGGTQQGEALKSGIMKATGAGPKKVLSEDEIRKKLMNQNKKNLESMKSKLDDPEDFATGGRAGFKDGEGIMQMASDPGIMDERNELSLQLFKKPIDLLTPEEMDLLNDEAERLMQKFASAPDPMDERNMVMENIAISEFGKPLKDLNEDEIIQIEEMMEEMTKIDRGAPSITLADGGRAAFKEGLLAKLNKPFKIDSGTLRSMFFNKNNPIITGFNTSELFDLVTNLSSSIPFADGGRAEYKDGPKDPRRRTFMKAAAGIASMIPLGGAKIIGKAAPVVAKAAEISGPALAKIVDTVMSLGKLISVKGRRVKEMVTKKKHEGVEVTEDIQDGSYIIKKGDKEIYYKPGRQDEMGIDDDIIEVIDKTVTKKAGGGVARLLGE